MCSSPEMSSIWSLRLISPFLVGANNLAKRKDGTYNRKLGDLMELKVAANPKPVKGVKTRDVVVDSETGVWVRLFIPTSVRTFSPVAEEAASSGKEEAHEESDKKMPVIFYFHGGGFTILSADFVLYDAFCRRLARKCEALVISVNYRRSPECRFPVAYDDCYAAVEWLRNQQHSSATVQSDDLLLPHNADLSHCFLMGDSAGGNIVHHVGLRVAGKDLTPVCIKAHILIQPFFGGEERTPSEKRSVPIISAASTDFYWRAYLPQGANRDHPACNIFGPNSSDLSNVPLPPSLVIAGGLDVLEDWEVRYVEGMKKAGKEVHYLFYKDGIHTFHLFNQRKIGLQLMLDMCAFIHGHCQ